MIQNTIVVLLFCAALIYLIRTFRHEFTRKEGCRGCGTCSTANIEKITQEIEKNMLNSKS